jgi:hypothetical protein
MPIDYDYEYDPETGAAPLSGAPLGRVMITPLSLSGR